jgi:DNA-binding beta-propeller fold protein YncE
MAASVAHCVELEPGDLVVPDAQLAALFHVDPVTGNRTIVSSEGTFVPAVGAGAHFCCPVAAAMDRNGNAFVLTGRQEILRIDPATGDRRIVSSTAVGVGPRLAGDTNLAVVAATGELLSGGSGPDFENLVLRIDPATGDRTIVAGGVLDAGPAPDLVLESSTSVVLTDLSRWEVLRVDLVTGNRTVLADLQTLVPDHLFFPLEAGIAVEPTGTLLVSINDYSNPSLRRFLVRLDPSSGRGTVLSSAEVGSGPAFSRLAAIDVDATSGDIFVLDVPFLGGSFEPRILRVDPATGDRTIVSSASVGAGLPLFAGGFLKVVPDPELVRDDVEIDIRPGSATNPIDPAGRGVIPVALLGGPGLDVRTVGRATLGFGPARARPAHREGCPHFADLNRDGTQDLLGHYRTAETGIAWGDERACLSGRVDGVGFEACDSIRTVRPRAAPGREGARRPGR